MTRARRARVEVKIVQNSKTTEIRETTCIEYLLLDTQVQRAEDMTNRPTEFLATFLKRDQAIRVYYLTNDINGIREMERLKNSIALDLNAGWKLQKNLHNHSFFLSQLNEMMPQGVLAPSSNDMQMFKSLVKFGIEVATITNGFDTVHIPVSEFGAYRSADHQFIK